MFFKESDKLVEFIKWYISLISGVKLKEIEVINAIFNGFAFYNDFSWFFVYDFFLKIFQNELLYLNLNFMLIMFNGVLKIVSKSDVGASYNVNQNDLAKGENAEI